MDVCNRVKQVQMQTRNRFKATIKCEQKALETLSFEIIFAMKLVT